MNRKKFYIITTSVLLLLLIFFEIVMYCIFEEGQLTQNWLLKTLCGGFPIVIIILSFIRDYILKKYDNNNKDDK